jgi:tetratricopeptide (TPR) repeat protein
MDKSQIDLFFVGLFTSWVAFQLQSVISIDNIALSIWGWVLGGVILRKTMSPEVIFGKTIGWRSYQGLISGAILLPVALTCISLARVEISMLRQAQYSKLEYSEKNKEIYFQAGQDVLTHKLTDNFYKQLTAETMFLVGYQREASEILDSLVRDYPQNPSYKVSRASMYEARGDLSVAVSDRRELMILDPWNAQNIFQLALNQKKLGNNKEVLILREKILSFVSKGELRERVILELVNL